MKHHFNITENRLDELKAFIRNNTPTVRFLQNPILIGKKWMISLSMETEDSNKLDDLFWKWYYEDNPKINKTTFWNRLINLFK